LILSLSMPDERMKELSLPFIKNASMSRQSAANTARGEISRFQLDTSVVGDARPETVSTFNPYQVGRMFRTSHAPPTPRPSTTFGLEPSIAPLSPRYALSPRPDHFVRRNRVVFGATGFGSLQRVGGWPEAKDFKKGAGITGTLFLLLVWACGLTRTSRR
jgi:hypothetical protein